jgi:hypothetical protein
MDPGKIRMNHKLRELRKRRHSEIYGIYGQVKRMPEERIPKLILEWVPEERRKRGRPRKTWMEVVQAAMTARNLEQNQWRNREEWRLVCGRRRQLL